MPIDYLLLIAGYGWVAVKSVKYGFTIRLRAPVDAHEFYFDFVGEKEYERATLMPNMFPMTTGTAPSTLYDGIVDGVKGVYIT